MTNHPDNFTFDTLRNDLSLRVSAWVRPEVSDLRLNRWLCSISSSGYVREASLRELIEHYQPGDENRILLRLEDWVPQVRDLAKEWTLSHFRELPFDAIVANQRLLLYLSGKQRARSDEVFAHIESDLLRRTNHMNLEDFLGLQAKFRRFLLSLSLGADARLRPWVLDDPEPFNRLMLLNHFDFEALHTWEVDRLAQDSVPSVRRGLFQSQIASGDVPSKELLVAFALDRNRSLRQLGQFYLLEFYDFDAYRLYKEREGQEFYYIADYRRQDDLEQFLNGVVEGTRQTRTNCLSALISCDPTRLRDLDVAALISQCKRSRALILPALMDVYTADELLELKDVIVKSSELGELSFLSLIRKKSFWVYVDLALGYLEESPSTALKNMVHDELQRSTRVYQRPSQELRASIREKAGKLSRDDWTTSRILNFVDSLLI